ncbi:hypothetical protein BV210_04875 [Halorientalis sp. IM1011]|nr:hypothetical protein BV210_04875 [Halorientalis sp. IM1011]
MNLVARFFGLLTIAITVVSSLGTMNYSLPFLDTDSPDRVIPTRGVWYYCILLSIVVWILTSGVVVLNHYTNWFRILSFALFLTLCVFWIVLTPLAIRQDLNSVLTDTVTTTDHLYWAIASLVPIGGPLVYIWARNKCIEVAERS